MTDNAQPEGQDVFDDSTDTGPSAKAGEMSFTTEDGGAGKDDVTEVQTNDKPAEDEDKSQTGEEDAETPSADQEDDLEAVTDAKGQKMIPEHRFKAALKKVTDELDQTKGKLKEYETPAVQTPDKDTDPEGHDLHVRMEASKSVMMEMREDYQEVINHYAEMAKDNDLLNQAVAKHPIPAKLAYDIAKKDLEIKDALAVRGSDRWKKFEQWEKDEAAKAKAETTEETNLNTVVNRGLKAVPNLNRSTNASPNRNVRKVSNGDSDDDLFKGAL